MTYRARGRTIFEVILAIMFVTFLVGFITVLCIGNYFRAKRAQERQRQRRLAKLSTQRNGGGNSVASPRSQSSGIRMSNNNNNNNSAAAAANGAGVDNNYTNLEAGIGIGGGGVSGAVGGGGRGGNNPTPHINTLGNYEAPAHIPSNNNMGVRA